MIRLFVEVCTPDIELTKHLGIRHWPTAASDLANESIYVTSLPSYHSVVWRLASQKFCPAPAASRCRQFLLSRPLRPRTDLAFQTKGFDLIRSVFLLLDTYNRLFCIQKKNQNPNLSVNRSGSSVRRPAKCRKV